METGINIGGTGASANPETVAQAAQAVVDVLTAGFEAHADQKTIRKALDVIADATEGVPGSQGVTVSNTTISSHDYKGDDNDDD